LAESQPEAEQDEIVAGLLRRLWATPIDGPFRPVAVMCDEWAAEFEERFTPGRLDPGLARAGMGLLRGLPADISEPVLLWTDLHAENVLAAEREPWLGIDPKPYVGDSAYDVVQHLLNCRERLASDPAGLAGRMAGLLDLDRLRVTRWLFARCVQESVGNARFRAAAVALAPAAEL
jgi:streptomycin 6-kinase